MIHPIVSTPEPRPIPRLDELYDRARAGSARAWRVLGGLALTRAVGGLHRVGYDCLHIAADRGDAPAAFLTRALERTEASETFLLDDVRRRLDETEIVEPVVQVETLLERPRLLRARAMFSAFECAYLVALAVGALRPSTVSSEHKQTPHVDETRRSKDVCFSRHDSDPLVHTITSRISNVVGVPEAHAERLSVIAYGIGGQFKPHYDTSPASYLPGATGNDAAGPRTISFIGYLSDGYAGGHTAFIRSKKKISAPRGDAIFFYNQGRDGQTDPYSLHSGMPVTEGEKWICVQWFRARPLHIVDREADNV